MIKYGFFRVAFLKANHLGTLGIAEEYVDRQRHSRNDVRVIINRDYRQAEIDTLALEDPDDVVLLDYEPARQRVEDDNCGHAWRWGEDSSFRSGKTKSQLMEIVTELGVGGVTESNTVAEIDAHIAAEVAKEVT